jgi:prophage antirepressor-like protein
MYMEKAPTIIETGKIYKDGKMYMPQRIRKELHITEVDTLIWQVQRLKNGKRFIVLSTEMIPIMEQGFSIQSLN